MEMYKYFKIQKETDITFQTAFIKHIQRSITRKAKQSGKLAYKFTIQTFTDGNDFAMNKYTVLAKYSLTKRPRMLNYINKSDKGYNRLMRIYKIPNVLLNSSDAVLK